MTIYQVSYTLQIADGVEIEANSQEEALIQFDKLELDELFNMRDLIKSIEIEEIVEDS